MAVDSRAQVPVTAEVNLRHGWEDLRLLGEEACIEQHFVLERPLRMGDAGPVRAHTGMLAVLLSRVGEPSSTGAAEAPVGPGTDARCEAAGAGIVSLARERGRMQLT